MAAPTVAMVLPVRFAHETRAVQTTTRELSSEGVFVRCIEPPALGVQVTLKLYLPGLAQAADFVGVVREVQPGKGEGGFWADFVSAELQAHERLLAVLFPPALPQRTESTGPVPLASLYRRSHAVHPPAPQAAPEVAEPLRRKASSGVGDLIQQSINSVVAERAAEALAAKRSSKPGPVPLPGAPDSARQPGAQEPGAAPAAGDVVLAGDAINRRAFPRYRARFAVRFSSVQDFVLEYAANISAGGVFVVTDHPPEMDAVITVVLELPGGGEPVNCKALVVHRVTKEEAKERNTQAGVGVQFIEADDQFRERIDQTIELILGEGQE
jgi:uncharacterized protein (TIGR02266 family)